jgi:hypothetical protein
MGRLARTLARRRCGSCERTIGLSLWPWSGHWFVTTHGLCDACYDLQDREVQAAARQARATDVPRSAARRA